MREITLGEVCTPVERCEPSERFGEEFTYIDLSAVDQRTKLISNARTLKTAEAPSRARQLVKAGDVLVSTVRPNLNAVAIVDERHHDSVASTGFCVLRPRTDLIDPRLLFARVQSPSFVRELSSRATGASYPAVTDSVVKSMVITLPHLNEQQRIAALLDEATQHITDLESAYTRTAALWTDFETTEMSSILEGLDCQWLRLGECCEILDSLRRPITKRDRRPGPFPYFGATGEVDRVAEYLFDEPLVLLGEDGAKWDRGEKSAFSVDGKCWVNNHAHVLRPLRDVVLDDWLVAYLCHADLSEFITGLTVPKLNQARMREIPIPVPPLAEQEALIARLGVVGEIVAGGRIGSDLRLRHLADLRQSVLESAFRGEL